MNGEQKVQLNHLDFERALGGRKLKLSFSRMEINKGRMNNILPNTALSKELADVLLDDVVVMGLIRNRNIVFSFTQDTQLIITDETPAVTVSEEAEEKEIETAAESA